jgi:hypothetical protein
VVSEQGKIGICSVLRFRFTKTKVQKMITPANAATRVPQWSALALAGFLGGIRRRRLTLIRNPNGPQCGSP